MDTSFNMSDEHSCKEKPIQMIYTGIQVSDTSKTIIAELAKNSSLEGQLYASTVQQYQLKIKF